MGLVAQVVHLAANLDNLASEHMAQRFCCSFHYHHCAGHFHDRPASSAVVQRSKCIFPSKVARNQHRQHHILGLPVHEGPQLNLDPAVVFGEGVVPQGVRHLHPRLSLDLQLGVVTKGTEQIRDRMDENGPHKPIVRNKTVRALPGLGQPLQHVSVQIITEPEGVHCTTQGLVLLDIPRQHGHLPPRRGHRGLTVREQEHCLHPPHPVVGRGPLALQPPQQAVPDVGVAQGLQVV
mmetsp:Transcript_36384/g.95554  ORF Transcript_36384/g.95554 Transcript_36384/m.95554 type:complete len:235 (-) Transcript_36384:444-1148(-)